MTLSSHHQMRRDNALQAVQEQMQAASEAKNMLLADAEREIRTPLNIIVGISRLLGKTELNARQREMVEALLANSEILLKLIGDLIDEPASDEDVADTEASHFPATRSDTVLVVEDYAPNLMVASMILDALGFKAVTAENGLAALELVEQAEVPFAAILMDVQMQYMDGFEATKRIRELEKKKGYRNTIIGVTAHVLAGDRERCINAGMDDYMSKPIHPDLLAVKLSRVGSKSVA